MTHITFVTHDRVRHEIEAENGTTVLWVTHDPHQVDRIADRRLRMARGRVVEGGEGP